MQVKFSNIKWDTDNQKVPSLPNEFQLEVFSECDMDLDGADILSDKFGYCVYSFDWEEVE